MTREDIIRMARQAGIDYSFGLELERFAALVAAAEREACARLADDIDDITGREIAANIRKRGQE